MLKKLLLKMESTIKIPQVQAHCDIPCKIYDPMSAQLAALSVVRYIDLIQETAQDEKCLEHDAQLIRLIASKEKSAEEAKHEVRIIWGDYIKQPQLDKHPQLHSLVHQIMQAGSACKQGVERAKGEKLVELINQFAAIFWDTKGVPTYTTKCPYPPSLDVVYPKLQP